MKYKNLPDSVVDSRLWLEDSETKIVWITLLVKSDCNGFANIESVENLARIAAIPVFKCEYAISRLGRDGLDLIKPGVGKDKQGWHINNYKEYDPMVEENKRRAKNRQYVRAYRERQKKLKKDK